MLRRHSLTAATGRGVRLLDRLAVAWGVAPRGTGTCVWFALDPAGPPGYGRHGRQDLDGNATDGN